MLDVSFFNIVFRLRKCGICLLFLVENGMFPQVGWRSIVYVLRCVLGAQMAVKTCRSDFLCFNLWNLDQVSRMLKQSFSIEVVFTAWHAKLFTWPPATCLWAFRIARHLLLFRWTKRPFWFYFLPFNNLCIPWSYIYMFCVCMRMRTQWTHFAMIFPTFIFSWNWDLSSFAFQERCYGFNLFSNYSICFSSSFILWWNLHIHEQKGMW